MKQSKLAMIDYIRCSHNVPYANQRKSAGLDKCNKQVMGDALIF